LLFLYLGGRPHGFDTGAEDGTVFDGGWAKDGTTSDGGCTKDGTGRATDGTVSYGGWADTVFGSGCAKDSTKDGTVSNIG